MDFNDPRYKPFPLPVRAIGPGSQVEEEALQYLEMPKGMSTYRPPVLPEREEVAGLSAAHEALHAVQRALHQVLEGGTPAPVSLDHLGPADRQLLNQVLGEGEVSARIDTGDGREVRIQESVFTGVWRIAVFRDGEPVEDRIEVAAVPSLVGEQARLDATDVRALALPEALPPGVMNAPSILTELSDQVARWTPQRPTHVVNLTLLPLSPEDLAFLGERLGQGRVVVLSRGYGNCRVTSTRVPHCWRVVYYNSQDAVILDTIEVTAMPDAVRAAPEDLQDSAERLDEVLAWLTGAP
ncbi:hydrogenase expression/formation protein [Caldimonas thermodepolymerans]|jgi:HupH hydrogenase expression protein, C-terminal conserved region.|uniref:Hydrogenase expression/formation protein n=1 Tax=Caldimonas thermodepolymerans TaxID=215580 RepID=A0A2S5T571_9BURK|nr:hydrogenase expression/formation protein [Caldimonas thermodepolymerans]PPE70079.1 hydrogenase expression/formation protein [Caldimonas thermodepolymerans]QPC31825.1 hydrogenase expression/formation protein [Caldimonas thermodepolymerans]RDI01669.1 hydrogenase-1 operon protein HyaF [Caldimonas thermodepolymerans]TCP05806.1 hydrogenase-1 operon protein HyaF [Caldimonas thermodepolymerans]UZG44609.1 hydrogenase expression/formation protein [Caldimonas thermodepolymerans]